MIVRVWYSTCTIITDRLFHFEMSFYYYKSYCKSKLTKSDFNEKLYDKIDQEYNKKNLKRNICKKLSKAFAKSDLMSFFIS